MRRITLRFGFQFWLWLCAAQLAPSVGAESTPEVPRFSLDYLDRTADPRQDFYRFACGRWLTNHPVPADKSRWGAFDELQQRNWLLIREILEQNASARGSRTGPQRQVGEFFAAAMDTNRIEQLKFAPIEPDLKRIAALHSTEEVFRYLGELHLRDVNAVFSSGVAPDAKNSEVEAFQIRQGGLGLPDRDYYLTEGFTKQREAYRVHVATMFRLLGHNDAQASAEANTVLELETELARASRPRVELRDPNSNYNKLTLRELESHYPALVWRAYFPALGLSRLSDLVVGQTNFLAQLNRLVMERPTTDWQTYFRWHVLSEAAPYLHAEVESENFAFYGQVLRGQPEPEPRWQRVARTIDASLGEALGRLYVEKHFPPAARERMAELVGNLRAVFQDRLKHLDWMTEATRTKALAKFERFTQKIGHPERFRDYSRIVIRRQDAYGNVQRARQFENRRQLARVGRAVDKLEWHMTPQTVNAYFNPTQNEIVFPAAILQPPYFDLNADDAVNYGAIGVVIGHEITHGYDDQGRKFDDRGNLQDWWTEADAREFEARAQKLVQQYGAYEPLPGQKVNGQLTLGENLADLGGASIAFEALQRLLAKDPSRRKSIEGFTPEQRFFLSLSQIWRTNWREAELRRRLTVDPHSPGQYRAVGPHVNLPEFFEAFGIQASDGMWRPPEQRAKVW